MTTRVILDCDPGHDDALAILLAARRLDLRAITTVAGNQTLARTTLNARRMCTVAGITDVPIAAGADRPLAQDPLYAGEIHGESGLDGPDFPPPTVDADPRTAFQLASDVLCEPTTVIATGPLTNVAALVRQGIENIERIVLMGGSTGRGNMAPLAEFNILADPEAADVVFRSGLPITMCGLDVTHRALATPQVLQRIRDINTPLARVCHELLTYFADSYRAYFGFECPPVHDPVAVAAVIDPTIIAARPVNVEIELTGTHTRGATVVDLDRVTGREPNALVATGLDVDRFWDLMIGAIR
ncbi:nucleoside hydrolase [Kutzneria sp. NPDC052558]|uniref:nucleoside hydrolase n=1 Tax=Kutzneria sp. NPDC052558 TaxID=3364121 RepID=UPI0037C8B38A